MPYTLYDDGLSIAFSLDGNAVLIRKSAIKNVTVIRNSIIKIQMGSCLNNIFIKYADVISPQFYAADILLNQISRWINATDPPVSTGIL